MEPESVLAKLQGKGPVTGTPQAGVSVVYAAIADAPLVDDHAYVTGVPSAPMVISVWPFAVRVAVGVVVAATDI